MNEPKVGDLLFANYFGMPDMPMLGVVTVISIKKSKKVYGVIWHRNHPAGHPIEDCEYSLELILEFKENLRIFKKNNNI